MPSVLPSRHHRGDCRHDTLRIAQHLRIVEPHNDVPEREQNLIALQVGTPILRLGMVRLTVALDQESVTDQQVCPLELADRHRRLRPRWDAGLVQQHSQDALGA